MLTLLYALYCGTPAQCPLQTFSERALDFSEEMLEVVQQKVHFCLKSHKRRFPRKRWNFPSEKLAVVKGSCSFHSELAMEIPP